MTFEEYQKLAERTSGKGLRLERVQMATLGLCGESGEFADYIKKVVYHEHNLNLAKIIEELGDVLWYISELCSTFGLYLDDVAIENLEKLRKRYPKGFSSEASINRKE